MFARLFLSALMLCASTFYSQVFAQENSFAFSGESVRPGINEKFVDTTLDVSELLDRFEIESREVYGVAVARFGKPGEDRGPTCHADGRVDKGVLESHALLSELVDVRGLDDWMSGTTERVIALVINKDEDDVESLAYASGYQINKPKWQRGCANAVTFTIYKSRVAAHSAELFPTFQESGDQCCD